MPSFYILQNNLSSIGFGSLKVWWNSVMNPSGPDLFMVERFLSHRFYLSGCYRFQGNVIRDKNFHSLSED